MGFATKEIFLTLMASNISFNLPAWVYSCFFCDDYMFLKLMKSIKLLDMHGSDISYLLYYFNSSADKSLNLNYLNL